jgi:hypothetical protein
LFLGGCQVFTAGPGDEARAVRGNDRRGARVITNLFDNGRADVRLRKFVVTNAKDRPRYR